MPAAPVGTPADNGAASYLADFLIEPVMRDARITRIYEGANEMGKLILAKDVDARQSRRA
jgi:alkylation response protein AidB-like acyl-CoA dehydrogenase